MRLSTKKPHMLSAAAKKSCVTKSSATKTSVVEAGLKLAPHSSKIEKKKPASEKVLRSCFTRITWRDIGERLKDEVTVGGKTLTLQNVCRGSAYVRNGARYSDGLTFQNCKIRGKMAEVKTELYHGGYVGYEELAHEVLDTPVTVSSLIHPQEYTLRDLIRDCYEYNGPDGVEQWVCLCEIMAYIMECSCSGTQGYKHTAKAYLREKQFKEYKAFAPSLNALVQSIHKTKFHGEDYCEVDVARAVEQWEMRK
jgi:hypothetical protein